MTTATPVVPPVAPPAPTPDELARWYAEREEWFQELMRLRAERPPLTDQDQAEITADWNWIHDQTRAGAVGTGLKQYAAVYRKEVVGLDTDAERLELAMAMKYPDINPDRFMIVYVG
jgi:hypothetical protein